MTKNWTVESKPSPEEKRRHRAERMRYRGAQRGGSAGLFSYRGYSRAAILRLGKNSRTRLNRILAHYSKVGDPAVFDSEQFPFAKRLEDNWQVIRAEAETVLRVRGGLPAVAAISPDHDRINTDRAWKAYFLYGYQVRVDRGCQRCPETAKLVETIPNLWSAFFSILDPGAHLVPHRGPTKAIITWHLPVIVPTERAKCWLRVRSRRRYWEEGKSFIFDDCRKHEVRNDTDEPRVVLLVHMRRPLRFPGSLLGRLILFAIKHSPFIRDARRNQKIWEDRFERLEQRATAEQRSVAAPATGAAVPTPGSHAPPPA